MSLEEYDTEGLQKWSFSHAHWEKLRRIHDQEMGKIVIEDEDVDN